MIDLSTHHTRMLAPFASRAATEIGPTGRTAQSNSVLDIIDFNGYWGGNLTIIVPADWSVEITFINGSLSFPHSLMVTRVYAQSEMPVKLTAKDAIWGAYTDPPEGIKYKERRQLNFVALQAGKYFLACARQTHLMDGHWIGFEVRNNLDQAVAVVHDETSFRRISLRDVQQPRSPVTYRFPLRCHRSGLSNIWRAAHAARQIPCP